MENLTVLIQKPIHFNHLSPNPICLKMFRRNPQFTWSYAFSKSSLHMMPAFSPLTLVSTHSLAINAASMICLPLMNAN
uniref:Putative ovule protein n=1 Tax=Solanum chacoense TaxID=4108 RepID=A0A0V0GHZ0_SOLCH